MSRTDQVPLPPVLIVEDDPILDATSSSVSKATATQRAGVEPVPPQ
jgi:hypothetical protein